MPATRFVQLGLGPLGQKLLQFALERKGLKLVAAVDPDPAKVGKDVGELLGLKRKIGVKVRASLGKPRADVALVATVSSLEKLESQVAQCAAAGLHVVSTCEELSYPWINQPTVARRIDRTCKKHNVACVGTGVNPGYLMDYLPAVLTTAAQKVTRVDVERVQDASVRRGPFQKKIGAGLTQTEFKQLVKQKIIRHVGLTESVHMIAYALGWKLDKTTETTKPVIATKPIKTDHVAVKKGQCAGVEQIGKGRVGNKTVIELRFRAAVGEPKSYDTVNIKGTPNITSTIEGGLNGDIATCAVTLNVVGRIALAAPGLTCMVDLPSVHHCA